MDDSDTANFIVLIKLWSDTALARDQPVCYTVSYYYYVCAKETKSKTIIWLLENSIAASSKLGY